MEWFKKKCPHCVNGEVGDGGGGTLRCRACSGTYEVIDYNNPYLLTGAELERAIAERKKT